MTLSYAIKEVDAIKARLDGLYALAGEHPLEDADLNKRLRLDIRDALGVLGDFLGEEA